MTKDVDSDLIYLSFTLLLIYAKIKKKKKGADNTSFLTFLGCVSAQIL